MSAIAHLDLSPIAHACGSVRLPGSKSISNRVLLLAALSRGTTTIHDVLDSDDTRVMLDALRQIGCAVEPVRAVAGQPVRVTGIGGALPAGVGLPGADGQGVSIFLGNAGTAMRPLTAVLALLGGYFTLHGVPRMHERPIGDLVQALRQLGCSVDCTAQEGFPPLRIQPPQLERFNPGQAVRVRGDVSSQFLTALLMALPLLAAQQAVTVEVEGELISRPYIHITLELLARFGIRVHNEGWQRFTIPAGSQYQSPGDIHVEADASSASYFIALGAIAAGGSAGAGDGGLPAGGECVEVLGVGRDSIQGDIRFADAARQMGARIESGPNWLRVSRGAWPLKAIDLDCNHIPDAAMTLAMMALYADGTTTLRNIASWRVKETDRIAAMTAELRKLGAVVEEGADCIRITPPTTPQGWKAACIRTYDDHRMAMCFSLAACNPARVFVRIQDPGCVAKTFPGYFGEFFRVTRPVAPAPVICIDGPTASGKGTVAARVAQALGFHLLDSGALYRIAALVAVRSGIELNSDWEDAVVTAATGEAIAQLIGRHTIRFTADQRVLLGAAAQAECGVQVGEDGEDISQAIRTEVIGNFASRISTLPAVRRALLQCQRQARIQPGLVADGRDMGTTIFPDAQLKVFLTASVACRASRRHRQLLEKGVSVSIDEVFADLQARDQRDMSRAVSPLKPAEDALHLDSSDCTVEQAVRQVLDWWEDRQPFSA